MTGIAPVRPPPLMWIQYLRAVAALMVVFHHARNPADFLFNPFVNVQVGASGVDVFFVVSGFIIYTAARHEPPVEFLKRRAIRVVPLYWLATLVTVAYALAHGQPVSFTAILKSLAFIPFSNPAFGGQIWPVLVPGWSLNFEMFFYLLFGLAMATRHRTAVFSVAILGLVALGAMTGPTSAIGQTYTSPLLLEFLAGAWLGIAFRRFDLAPLWPLLPLGFLGLLASHWLPLPGIIEVTIPAVAIVAGALGMEARGFVVRSPLMKQIGDASYSIYLSHSLLLFYVMRAWQQVPLTGWAQFTSVMASALAAAALGGLAIHFAIERPMTAALNRRFTKPAVRR